VPEYIAPTTKQLLQDLRRLLSESAIRLLSSAGINKPPVDVYLLAKHLDEYIEIEDFIGLSSCGTLSKTKRGFLIQVDCLSPVERQRFIIAHELSHIILQKANIGQLQSIYNYGAPVVDDIIIERTCNELASALLMPKEMVNRQLEMCKSGFNLDKFFHFANQFAVSYRNAAIRLTQFGKDYIFICAKLLGNKHHSYKLRVTWAAFPRQKGLFVPRFQSIPAESVIYKAYTSNLNCTKYGTQLPLPFDNQNIVNRRVLKKEEVIELGNLKKLGEIEIEAMRTGTGVLAFVHV